VFIPDMLRGYITTKVYFPQSSGSVYCAVNCGDEKTGTAAIDSKSLIVAGTAAATDSVAT